ncbi:acylphosphatase [Qipengyuania sp. JC766]|uniref:acylphosphatase n=1 Tax=Qipengyuania sp. JC766 TaxID=3232139 RepID=UPI003459CF8B
MTSRHLIVHGTVQGVFYRDWTVAAARNRGVTGWVRNRQDGTVEARLEGEEDAVETLIAAMHEGPPSARVERIDQNEAQTDGFASFERI